MENINYNDIKDIADKLRSGEMFSKYKLEVVNVYPIRSQAEKHEKYLKENGFEPVILEDKGNFYVFTKHKEHTRNFHMPKFMMNEEGGNMATGGDVVQHLSTGRITNNGIMYDEAGHSIHGVYLILFPKDKHTKEDTAKAKAELRHKFDVTGIKISDENDWDELYKINYFRDPRIRALKWYQIEQDENIIRRERKKGTSPKEFVEKFVLPFTKQTEKKMKEKSGNAIYSMRTGGGVLKDVSFFDTQFTLAHLVDEKRITEAQMDSILDKILDNRIKISELEKIEGVTPEIIEKIKEVAKTGQYISSNSLGNENRIKLVVIDEHTLGYINPDAPTQAYPLQVSILKGGTPSYPFGGAGQPIYLEDKKVRLASERDFDEYRVSFEGYKNDPAYEYAHQELMATGGGAENGDKYYALVSDGMHNKWKVEIKSVSFWKGSNHLHAPSKEIIKEFLAQIPHDERIGIYDNPDYNFHGKLHSAYTLLYTNGAVSVDAIIDSENNIIWNKYEGSKYKINISDYKAAGVSMKTGGGAESDDITIIIISDKAPLSIALNTITGKGWNTQGFEGDSNEFIENSTGRKFKTYTVKEAKEKGIKEGFMIPAQTTIKEFYESAEKKGLHTTASEYMKNNWLTPNAVDSLIGAYATNTSPDDYQKLLGRIYKQQGGNIYEADSTVTPTTPMYIEGGAVASGFYLIYQPWDEVMNGKKGTIRTNPQNYWVASINKDGSIVFDSWEGMVKDIDKNKVKELWEAGQIPTEGAPVSKEEGEYTVSKDSTEYLIDQELKPLIDKVRKKAFMPDSQAGISDADVLGIIVSKYNRGSPELIKETCVSAFEDANYSDAAEAVSKFIHGGDTKAKTNKPIESKSDVLHTISYTLRKDVTDKTKYKRGYIQTVFSGYGVNLFPPQIKAYDLLDDNKELIKRLKPKEAEEMMGTHKILKGQDLAVRSHKEGGDIESETPILPYVVAELVAEKAVFEKYKDQTTNWKNLSQSEKDKLNTDSKADIEKLSNYLIERAETHYEHNPTFKKQIKSAKGLATLYTFMYHWAGIEPEGKVLSPFHKNIENWEKAKVHHAHKKLSVK